MNSWMVASWDASLPHNVHSVTNSGMVTGSDASLPQNMHSPFPSSLDDLHEEAHGDAGLKEDA
jgi:hypothetical protein